jgi:hypothetical protein
MRIRVVPSVSVLIVRRSREATIGLADSPIWLALEIGSVAASAMFPINRLAVGDLALIFWIGNALS